MKRELIVNGKKLAFEKTEAGTLVVKKIEKLPDSRPELADLKSLDWYGIDTLREVSQYYNISGWTAADLEHAYTWHRVIQKTPTSLFASDYGFHTSVMVFIGKSTATGVEESLAILTQGGSAFAHSIWVDGTHLGAFVGSASSRSQYTSYKFKSKMAEESSHTITVVIDNMGLESNWVARNTMKEPRGILDWELKSSDGVIKNNITWVLTGNLGGEDYLDKTRGPLNEGGFFAERHVYHLPSPPINRLARQYPFDGLDGPGAVFYTTKFVLDLPANHDNPLRV
jgi:beta-galactosidase